MSLEKAEEGRSLQKSDNPLCYCYAFRGQGIFAGSYDNQKNNNLSPPAAGILEKKKKKNERNSRCCFGAKEETRSAAGETDFEARTRSPPATHGTHAVLPRGPGSEAGGRLAGRPAAPAARAPPPGGAVAAAPASGPRRRAAFRPGSSGRGRGLNLASTRHTGVGEDAALSGERGTRP